MALHEDLAKPLKNILEIELHENNVYVSRARTTKLNHDFYIIGVVEIYGGKGGCKVVTRYVD